MLKRKGQTILEYTVIMIIILGVLIAMKDYIKRGIQGRWKTATDNFGDQYDPNEVNSSITYSTQSNSQSSVEIVNGLYDSTNGQWTNRIDLANTLDTKTGFTQVGNND